VSAFITDVVIASVYISDVKIAYGDHIGGYIGGTVASLMIGINEKVLPYERWVRFGAACAFVAFPLTATYFA
jgi:hypothetical protein